MQILKPSPIIHSLKFCEGLTARASQKRRYQYGKIPDLKNRPKEVSTGAYLVCQALAEDEDCYREKRKDLLATYLCHSTKQIVAQEGWRIADKLPALAAIAVEEFIEGKRLNDNYCGQKMGIQADSFRKAWRGEKLYWIKRFLFCWVEELRNYRHPANDLM